MALCGGTKCVAALLEDASLIIKNEGVIALNLMAAVQDGMCVCVCVCVCGWVYMCACVWFRFTYVYVHV